MRILLRITSEFLKRKNMKKKPKNIHLTEQAIESLSIMAIKKGTNFKNFVEQHLEVLAVKAVRQKGTK